MTSWNYFWADDEYEESITVIPPTEQATDQIQEAHMKKSTRQTMKPRTRIPVAKRPSKVIIKKNFIVTDFGEGGAF